MTFFPKDGELRGSERWDRLSGAWVPADEWQARRWAREDAAFARKANQGELKCPMILRDSMKTLQSQVTGKWYDSKSNLRKEYRDHDMIEIGNEVKPDQGRFWSGKPYVDPKVEREQHKAAAIAREFLDIGGEKITKIVHDEDGMKRLISQGKA
jgi:hypothetical protein